MDTATPAATSQADLAYGILKRMTIDFELKPGERVNEVTLSKQLDISRTPLREALNRLASERLLAYRPGKGFYCRELGPKEITDLYELRGHLERLSVQLACERASDDALEAFERTFQRRLRKAGLTAVEDILDVDERFHLAIAALSGNGELVSTLENLNNRIRFIRLIDLEDKLEGADEQHLAIVERLLARDAEGATRLMASHVSRRAEEIVAAVKEGFARIYLRAVN